MSNNLFRKGLALGVVAALGSTAIAGSPAFASDTISLTPSAGTTYNTLLDSPFTLASSVGLVAQGVITNGQIMYKVTNAGAAPLAFKFATGSATLANFTTATSGDGSAAVFSSSATSATFKPRAIATGNGVLADKTAVNKLSISTTAETTTTITVQAFLDANNSGALDSGDTISDVRTVKFIRGSEVTGTLALDPVNAGVNPTAQLTFNNDINYEQITLPTGGFVTNGAAAVAGTTALNSDKNAVTLTAAGPASAGQVISAKAEWLRYDGDTTKSSATSSALTVAAASTASTGTATLATSKDVASTTAATGTQDVERVVRAGVKSLTAKVAYKNSSSAALAAGAPVTVQVTANTLATGEEVTVGTKTVKSGTTSATYYTATDASGAVEIPITAKNGGNTTDVTITVTSASVVKTFGLLWQTAAATSLIETKAPLGYATRVVADGATVDVAYVLVDQFKQPFTRADYNYRAVLTTDGTNTISSPIVALNNGAGSASVVANSPSAADFNLTATVQYQTGTGAWTAFSGPAITAVTAVDVATIQAPSAITTGTIEIGSKNYDSTATTGATASANGLGNLADQDLAAIDRRVDDSTVAAIGFGATVSTKLSGTVTAANGSVVVGTPVKVAAAGQAFSTDATGTTYVAMNEITVYTNASGQYTVYAFSKTAGTVTYTTTAGAVTKTQDVKYAGVTTAGAGSVLTVAAPAVSQAGRSVDVTAKLVDKFGNPISGVEVKFTITGAGYLTSASGNTAADGSVSTKIVAGLNDLGDAVVTATTTIDSKSSAVAKTVTFGQTDGYIDVLNGKRASVTWSMAKGKRVAFLLDGVRKYNFVQTGDAELNLQFNLKKGTHNIKLIIGGVIVDDITVKITK